ncbi:MAG: NAD-dependent epimerase/dehydratase family protein [Opitutae bacterium]|nr:NAD-dependent epimerase/dehydratase family protein [Opitutae bacterium]MBT7852661.1 NAD-dependent epimerase/dehydratase family protein [Opitutae bacterium]
MKVLVTGSTGMIGSHFVSACEKKKWVTAGLSRSTSHSRQSPILNHQHHECDILDRGSLLVLLEKLKPDIIIHMAAQAFNAVSWGSEDYTHQANFTGTLNLLNAARQKCPKAKILLACSSAEYGDVRPEDCPLKEERLLRPITPYGVSKASCEALGYQYFANYGMQVYLPRLFIHVGTGHPPATAIQNFARQIALIKKGRIEPVMRVGRLDTARDFIDVRDGVDGMLQLLIKGQPGQPINICNQKAHTIKEVLDTLLEVSGVTVTVEKDPTLLRPSDEPLLLGNNSRLQALGWKRQYTLTETLKAVYEDWLTRTPD